MVGCSFGAIVFRFWTLVVFADGEWRDMQISEVLNLVALVVVPIAAVLIGQYLQTRSKKRDDRRRIFEEIMASRIFGLSAETVRAYNMIHLAFASEKEVREKWSEYYSALCVENPDREHLSLCEWRQLELLKAMAKALGYRDDVSQAALDAKYVPMGLVKSLEAKESYDSLVRELSNKIRNGESMPKA